MRLMILLIFQFFLIGIFVISAFGGVLLLKSQINQNGDLGITDLIVVLVQRHEFWLALLFYGIAFFAFIVLLKYSDLSRLFPMIVGLNVLLTAFGAAFMLHETISLMRIAGISTILIGIILIYLS